MKYVRRTKAATKEDWKTTPMPLKRKQLKWKMTFSAEEIENIKMGFVPMEMEDRWFSYFEDGCLYIHRSWSGLCVYIVKFNFETGIHRVTVNRDRKQYTNDDDEMDIAVVHSLVSRWAGGLNGYDIINDTEEENEKTD